MKRICVIGAGYVGLTTAACLADLGNRVACVDINEEKIAMLQEGRLPIFEPGLEEIVRRNMKAGRLSFTTSYEEGINGLPAEFVFIAVGTPEGVDGEADLRYVRMAAERIGEVMDHPLIIVNKSTVPVGTGDWVADIVRSRQRRPIPFWVVSNPEFLREGSAVYDFMNPDRIVLGSLDREAAEKVAQLYLPLRSTIMITDLRTAEMIKYASNAFLATKISFINEIANICEALGADVKEVAAGMGYDKRIGRAFLDAGVGWGGSCFHGDTIVYAMTTQGLHVTSIRDLFYSWGGPHAIVVYPEQLWTLTFDPEQAQIVPTRVQALTRRPYQGQMVEIYARMGRRIVLTADHPVIRYREAEGIFEVVPAAQVQPGDRIPLPLVYDWTLPIDESEEMDLLTALIDAPIAPQVKVRALGGKFSEQYDFIKKIISSKDYPLLYEIYRKNYMPLRLFARINQYISTPATQIDCFTNRGRSSTTCPGAFRLDENFARLIGYYLAEGWISLGPGRYNSTRERIGFSFGIHESDLIQDLHNLLDYYRIRYKSSRQEGALVTLISSRILAYLIRDVLQCGTNSYTKSIPPQAFGWSRLLRIALLRGLFSGDGSITLLNQKRHVNFEFATVSPKLAYGVLLMLQSLGIVASVAEKMMNKSKVKAYVIRVNGFDQIVRIRDMLSTSQWQEAEAILAGYQRRIAPLGYRNHEGFATVEVVSVQKYETNDSVFSMETEHGTLIAGPGIWIHNCFPKDVKALIHMAVVHGCHPQLLQAVVEINRDQRRRVVWKLKEILEDLRGMVIGLLGLAFKPNTDDIREAPALEIAGLLLQEGAVVRAYDPVAMPNAARVLPQVIMCADPYELAAGADALVVVTDWNEFKHLDLPRIKQLMRRPVIIDGRNIYEPEMMRELGFIYRGIGRGYNATHGKEIG